MHCTHFWFGSWWAVDSGVFCQCFKPDEATRYELAWYDRVTWFHGDLLLCLPRPVSCPDHLHTKPFAQGHCETEFNTPTVPK